MSVVAGGPFGGGIYAPRVVAEFREEGKAKMLQHQRVFELSQLACLPDGERKGDRIVDWGLARESDTLAFLTERSSDVFAAVLREKGENPGSGAEEETSVRALKWFDDLDLRPVCVSFSPGEDYVLVAAVGGDLFVVPVQLLVQDDAPRRGKGEIRLGDFSLHQEASMIMAGQAYTQFVS